MNRILRAPWHDYTQRCIYMVTLNKFPGVKNFGTLEGDFQIAVGQRGGSFVSESENGRAIKEVLRRFYTIEPNIRILQYSIMPDHVHILLFVEYPTQEELGRIVARFKVEVNNKAGIERMFAKGFNDQILKKSRSLDTLYRYIRENPRRLAVRRAFPEYFRRTNSLRIGKEVYQAYGNFQLLENPFREQVVVHRADSEERRRNNLEQWLYTASNGGVLVSPFISPAEKAVRDRADAIDGRFILIVPDRMDDRYKPVGHDFDLCESGRMLILSAGLNVGMGDSLTRQNCLAMNALAATICCENAVIPNLL